VKITIALAVALLFALGCPADARKPEAVCADACMKRAKDRCDQAGCERGCAFVLDRIVENEHLPVIDCVGRRTGSATLEGAPKDEWRDGKCGDREWAECAVLVGIRVDGGAPAPPPVDEHPHD
jgi:hypothetical protein